MNYHSQGSFGVKILFWDAGVFGRFNVLGVTVQEDVGVSMEPHCRISHLARVGTHELTFFGGLLFYNLTFAFLIKFPQTFWQKCS